MARVLQIGYGPLPTPDLEVLSSAALRSLQFLNGLRAAGHDVDLFLLPSPKTETRDSEEPRVEEAEYFGFKHQRFNQHNGEFAISEIDSQLSAMGPDAIVGVGTYPSYIAAMLPSNVPLWSDLDSHWMAEIQGRCRSERDDSRLVGAWAIERSILRRLDKFSAVSRPQLHAVLGEMGGVGRLNKHTFDYAFGNYIPNAAHDWNAFAQDRSPLAEPLLRGKRVPQSAFIILWSGSFDLATDAETLLTGVEDLMRRHEQVHFVATGGEDAALDAGVYARFCEAVAASTMKDRFHLLGWIPLSDLLRIYGEANIGLCVDDPNYQTFFGARSRLNAMASAGLAIGTTLGTEISEWLEDADAAVTWAMGDPTAMVEALEPWVDQSEGLREFSRRANKLMQSDFGVTHTLRHLTGWLEDPTLAPDNESKMKQSAGELADLNAMTINTLEGQSVLLDQHDARTLLQSAREMENLKRSSWFKLYKRTRKLMG